MKNYHRALTIAGSDSGGGAGIQADLKTFSALGCYGMSVITALTAQNTVAVTDIHPVPPDFIAAQLDAVLGDIGVDAVKIGMLHSPEVIRTVASRLSVAVSAGDWVPVVLDPVMVAKSGDKLLQDDAVQALKEDLIPLAHVITPNLPEASVLLGRPVNTLEDMAKAVRDLSELGPAHVLLKGGHLTGDECTDMLYIKGGDKLVTFKGKRVPTPNSHGTGCTLSSAMAAHIALGLDLETAVARAKEYLTQAIKSGASYTIGHGHGPVHHFHATWE